MNIKELTANLATYSGIKTVRATPCTKGDAEKALKRDIASNHSDIAPGYLVVYADGYKSWSPKDTFEEVYHPTETYAERMRFEAEQLRSRIQKANAFLLSENGYNIAVSDRELLKRQIYHMLKYLDAIMGRIKNAESI